MNTATELTSDEDLDSDLHQQFVTFRVGEEIFAVDMGPVQEIIRVPELVRVPLTPLVLSGLANLRGKVLPVVSLRRMFGMEVTEHDEATRAVVFDVSQPLGFVVDRVTSVIGVEPGEIRDASHLKTSVNSDFLQGIIQPRDQSKAIMVLDMEYMIRQEFSQLMAESGERQITDPLLSAAGNDDLDTADEDIDDVLQLVSFSVNQQEYAIAIEDVREIVQIPDTVTEVPKSPPHIIGLINLRDQLLPLVDLRLLFALEPRHPDDKTRIVVVSCGGHTTGILVDAVSEVLRIPVSVVEDLVPLMARETNLRDITKICRLNEGKRLVSILSVDQMLDQDELKKTLSGISEEDTMQQDDALQDDANDSDDNENQVVVFRLDGEEFAVPITSIQEIVRIPEQLIRVPKSPEFLKGVINLRGTVLPVIDLRTRLGMAMAERNERQRIVVFLIRGLRTGFIVDQVTEVLRLPDNCVEESLKITDGDSDLFSGMANIQDRNRMIQLINPESLLMQDEIAQVEAL